MLFFLPFFTAELDALNGCLDMCAVLGVFYKLLFVLAQRNCARSHGKAPYKYNH